jgi:hypothetical protein
MPMIDVYAAAGTFPDKHRLAQDLANAVMRWEKVPPINHFKKNTAAFVHDLLAEAISNAVGDSHYVGVQVPTEGAIHVMQFGWLTRLSPRPPEQGRVNFFGDLCVVTNIVVTHQRMCKAIHNGTSYKQKSRSGSRYRKPHSMPIGDKPCPTAYRPC